MTPKGSDLEKSAPGQTEHLGQHSHPCTPGDGAGESPPSLSELLATIPPHLHRILDQLLPRLVDQAIRRRPPSHPARQLVRLSGEDLVQLGADYVAVMTVPQLARRYAIHRTTVLGHLQQFGIERRGHVRKLTDQQVTEAARLYDSGLSLAKVGQHMDVDAQTVRKEFAKAGVPVRPRNGWPTR